MLLTFRNSQCVHFYLCILFFSSFAISEQYSDKLNVHGFISQGIANNKGSNFISDDDGITFELTEIGLNFSYQLTDSIRFAGQTSYLNGGNRYDEGLTLDYLLVDWNFYSSNNSQGHFYAGRIKNYHWLYSSIRDVPVSRPSIILPQSIYLDAARDAAIGGDGLAFAYSYSNESLGKFDFTISSSFNDFTSDETRNLIGDFAQGNVEHKDDLQASLYWTLNSIPLTFGIAITDSLFNYENGENDILINGDIDLLRYYINVEYFTEKWTLSAEFIQEELQLSELFFNDFSLQRIGQGGFVQAQYRPNHRFKMLMRYERYYGDKDDRDGEQAFIDSGGAIPAFFSFQHDFTLGFSYDISANFRVDIEHHWVTGTARLTPIIIPDVVINSEKNWQLSVAQISYWF